MFSKANVVSSIKVNKAIFVVVAPFIVRQVTQHFARKYSFELPSMSDCSTNYVGQVSGLSSSNSYAFLSNQQ